MTRKDYVRIAQALYNAKPNRESMLALDKSCVAWLACITSVAHELSKDNPRFDVPRFLGACSNGAMVDYMYAKVRALQACDDPERERGIITAEVNNVR